MFKELFARLANAEREETLAEKGEVMLELIVEEGPSRCEGSNLSHNLKLKLLGFNEFIHSDGTRVPYVEQSGIYVPSQSTPIATIDFFATCDQDNLISRKDERKGRIYAPFEQVNAAWDAIDDEIAKMESHRVSVRESFPDAVSDRDGTAFVSIKEYWTYFKAFTHDPFTTIKNRHYHTHRDKSIPRLALIPGGGKVLMFRSAEPINPVTMWADLAKELN